MARLRMPGAGLLLCAHVGLVLSRSSGLFRDHLPASDHVDKVWGRARRCCDWLSTLESWLSTELQMEVGMPCSGLRLCSSLHCWSFVRAATGSEPEASRPPYQTGKARRV